MDDQQAVAWLHRRAGFGLHPDVLAGAADPATELDRMFDPDAAGIPAAADPWAGRSLDVDDGGRRAAVVGWISHLVSTARPYQDRRTWMLHGWLVSSLAKVTVPRLMVDQIRLFMATGGGSYADLLRSVTVDPAMLVYLDGRTSTAAAPNENYARELMELFALGVGRYDEADVKAAARALTGWVAGPRLDGARLVPSRHDDTPQVLLGVAGVTDVDGVVDAVVGHPEHPRFVARHIVREYLGDPDDPALADAAAELASVYRDTGLALDPVIRRALELGLDGVSRPIVLAPLPWLVIALRVTGASIERFGRAAATRIRQMGQLPLLPPDVSGWPRGDEWFSASSLVARAAIAAEVAAATPARSPVRAAVEEGDLELVARHLGLTEPFSASTTSALRGESDPVDRLTLALISPENLLA